MLITLQLGDTIGEGEGRGQVAKRDVSLDVAKGIAISAIVLGHVWRGLDTAGLVGDRRLFIVVDTSLYMWHLTVFAFAAGLFVQRGIAREGAWRYAGSRDLNFLWLYVIWSAIQGVVKLAAADSVNNKTTVADVLEMWHPEGQMWFFGWIALMMALAAATRPWETAARATAVITVSAVVSAVMWGLNGSIVGTQGLGLTVYFVVGAVWGGDHVAALLRRASRWFLGAVTLIAGGSVAILVAAVGATPPTSGGDSRTIGSTILGITLSTGGLAAALAVARLIAGSRVGSAVAYVGSHSLSLFVAHIVFASGTRIVLLACGIDSLLVHVALGLSLGIFGPLGLQAASNRVGVRWLFARPTRIHTV